MTELPPDATTGERIKFYRVREGMSRTVLGQLVGMSAEWVKKVETGALKEPRLEMLHTLARVFRVDIAELTGRPGITSTITYGKHSHAALDAVARALASYQVVPDARPPSCEGLAIMVGQAWSLWHGSANQRTAVAGVLPELLTQAKRCVRAQEGLHRRQALVLLSQVYHLVQLFASFQPRPELVYLCGDRAMTAAQEADSPHAIATAAWYLNHVYRDAGEAAEERIDLARQAASLLSPERGGEGRSRFGLLHLAMALSYGKLGREGDAWRHFDIAEQHVPGGGVAWHQFSAPILHSYAITLHTDLARKGDAVKVANKLAPETIGSLTRRSFAYIEMARAHHLRKEFHGAVSLLRRAYATSPETVQYNLFTRRVVPELAVSGGTAAVEAQELAREIGIHESSR